MFRTCLAVMSSIGTCAVSICDMPVTLWRVTSLRSLELQLPCETGRNGRAVGAGVDQEAVGPMAADADGHRHPVIVVALEAKVGRLGRTVDLVRLGDRFIFLGLRSAQPPAAPAVAEQEERQVEGSNSHHPPLCSDAYTTSAKSEGTIRSADERHSRARIQIADRLVERGREAEPQQIGKHQIAGDRPDAAKLARGDGRKAGHQHDHDQRRL